MLSPEQIRQLIPDDFMHRPVPNGLSLKEIIPASPHGPLKLRAYPDEAAAFDRLRFLAVSAQAGVLTPPLLGSWQRFLVFEHLPLDGSPENLPTFAGIGKSLARLNAQAVRAVTPSDLLEEVSGWLGDIVGQKLLAAAATAPILETLRGLAPAEAPVTADYWDAMPHNFGWHAGEFYLLDEKHIRSSFPGVGLIKPMLVLEPGEWEIVRSAYAGSPHSAFFEQQQPFLTYFYLLAALHFYSLLTTAGRCRPAQNARLARYRRMLLDRTPRIPAGQRRALDLQFYLAHRPSLLPALRRRMRKTGNAT